MTQFVTLRDGTTVEIATAVLSLVGNAFNWTITTVDGLVGHGNTFHAACVGIDMFRTSSPAAQADAQARAQTLNTAINTTPPTKLPGV
jgi:hypothetical protein